MENCRQCFASTLLATQLPSFFSTFIFCTATGPFKRSLSINDILKLYSLQASQNPALLKAKIHYPSCGCPNNFTDQLVDNDIFEFGDMQAFRFMSCYYLGKPEDNEDVIQYQHLYLEEYEKEINDGIMILNYWVCNRSLFERIILLQRDEKRLSIRPFLFLIVADSVEIVTVCVAATIATLTYRQIRKAQNISESIRTFHLRILIAASAQVISTYPPTQNKTFFQTLTPVLFVYTPYFFNVTLPVFRVYSPAFSALSMVLLSCFPCIDAVVIIVLMKPYRDGLMKIMGMRKRRPIVDVASSFTTNSHNSSQNTNDK